MSLLTTGLTGNVGIKQTYEPGFQKLVWRNGTLLPVFGPAVDSGGDESYRWKANTVGNTSVEIFNEDQSQPSPGQQSYVNLAQPYLHFRFMTRVTGHVRAALRSQWFNAIEEEQTLGNLDLVDLINTTFMDSTNGLEAQIAATGSFGGVTRGSATYIESLVTALNRDLQLTDILDMVEALSDNDRGRRPQILLAPLNQCTRIYQFAAPGGMKIQPQGDPAPNFMMGTPTFTEAGIATGVGAMQVCGMACHCLPDWTDTTLIYLPQGCVKLIEHEGYTVKEMAPQGDSDVLQTSWRGLLLCMLPKFCGKHTGATA